MIQVTLLQGEKRERYLSKMNKYTKILNPNESQLMAINVSPLQCASIYKASVGEEESLHLH